MTDSGSPFKAVAIIHGLYYAVTGFWPLLSIRSFQLVSGPKKDLWLVKTAGLLIGVIGIVLVLAGVRGRTEPEFPLLAVGSAVSLAGIDIVYVQRGRIWRIYLLDAATELTLAATWLVIWRRRARE